MSKRAPSFRRPPTALVPTSRRAGAQPAGPTTALTAAERLTALIDAPRFARVVPHLAPELLHQIVRHRGPHASEALVAAASPAQLAAVFDIDLWGSARPGLHESFDADRFVEWVEALVEAGAPAAGRILGAIDPDLVVVGLSRHIRVFDAGVFEPTAQSDDEPFESPMSAPGLDCQIGGFLVRPIALDAWAAIQELLLALRDDAPALFERLMTGCRALSNSVPEVDGLDDLLLEPEQAVHDVALRREHRRSEQGYTTPEDARAFLKLARHRRKGASQRPGSNVIAAAFFRDADATASARADEPVEPAAPPTPEDAQALAELLDVMSDAGLLPSRGRRLLEGGVEQEPASLIEALMEQLRTSAEDVHAARTRELAFLTNTLMAGCGVMSRRFTVPEASDAALAVCNLGLESSGTTSLAGSDLVTAFEVGWSIVHEEVSLAVADRLVEILGQIECLDPDVQKELSQLRRTLVKARRRDTPWEASEALDAIASLDAAACVALRGLLGECPVVADALVATMERRTGGISPTAFEPIATAQQIRTIHGFMDRLIDLLG